MSSGSRSRLRRAAPYGGVLLLGLIAFLLPQVSPTSFVLSLATTALIYAIAAAGLGFLWGQSGQLSLAHAAVFGIGAYTAAVCAKQLGLSFAASLPISTKDPRRLASGTCPASSSRNDQLGKLPRRWKASIRCTPPWSR